ncbi:MAG: HIT family protein [Alphaproteobacteria bacterium]|nr:MAG: HIT family protein [Alphaproteobacteria bacterium]
MSYDPDNIFAKIIRGELPSFKVYEDDETFSFMDIFPQTKGHTLVIPKTAGKDLFGTEEKDVLAAIRTTRKVAAAVDKVLQPDGMRIAQFNRAPAGQTVYHLHFHILPVFEGIAFKHHNTEQADMDELKELAAKIASEL